jgi:hypothetical protein
MLIRQAIVAGAFLVGLFSANVVGQSQPRFTELSLDDVARLDKQRAVVASAAKGRYGAPRLVRSKDDLPILQRLIDDKVFGETQTYELQCLGVAFGDVLASDMPLRWVMVTDEFGTDPTLRFKDTSIQVNALTMISKRVERGERVNLAKLVRINREQVSRMEKEFQK